MTLQEIRQEIDALPGQLGAPRTRDTEPRGAGPQILARQGRLLLRLSAASEAGESRLHSLETSTREALTELTSAVRERESAVRQLQGAVKEVETRARKTALAAIRLIDTLDLAHQSAQNQGDLSLARELASARRDGAARLAALGMTEIMVNAGEPLDGQRHEGVATTISAEIDRYHVVSVVRSGWQRGGEILRRVEVVTAE